MSRALALTDSTQLHMLKIASGSMLEHMHRVIVLYRSRSTFDAL
jgi:hypothetical protein